MPRGQVQHIDLTVNSIKRSAPFYDAVLGFLGFRRLRIDDLEEAVWQTDFADGTHCTIAIRPAQQAQELQPKEPDRSFNGPGAGPSHLAWSATTRVEVDELYARLKEIGARIINPPAVHPKYEPGYYAVYFADPDGLQFAFAHAPKSY
jgi:catechol 2,3-dioxygenase-like lactoylglutathione lyase family enzyme